MTSTISAETVAEPWATVAAQWRQRDDTQLRHIVTSLSDQATVHLEALRDTDLFRAEVDGSTIDLREEHADRPDEGGPLTAAAIALLDLCDGPGHFTSVVLLIYLQALIIWEESDDLRQVRALAVALDRATTLRPPPPEERDLVAAVREMCWSVLEQLQVENGVFCSCPIATAEHAERTVEAVRRADHRLARVDADHLAGLRFVLAEDLRVTGRFFTELAAMSDAVSAWIDDPPASVAGLSAAIDAAQAAVRALEPDVLASELHTHSLALERMRASANLPQLHLAEGTIVYLYPFGLPEERSADLVAQLLDGGRPRPDALGGLSVEEIRPVTVVGGWQQELCLGQRNRAVVVHLEELALETTAGAPDPGSARALPPEDTVVTGLRPQVRLSTLGNHHLRIECRMEDVELHSLDQAMRRIGRASGREILRTAGGERLPGGYLCDLAERIVADLQTFLADPHGQRLDAREPDLLSTAHVLLSARSLVVHERDAVRPCTASEVTDVLGAAVVLAAPRSSAGSFEWWLAQEVPEPVNVLAGKGRSDSLMARTLASTLVYAPGLADWQTTELDQMAEHVASVGGALQAWGDHLGHYEVLVARDLDAVEATGDALVIRTRLKQLAQDASRARLMLGQLRPVNLCRNAADRAIVEALQAEAGVTAQEQSVYDGLEVLGAQQGRLAAEAERMRADRDRLSDERNARIEDRQARVQRRLDLWLAIVSIVGLVSLADFLNNAHDVDGAIVPWAECALIVLVVVVMTTLYLHRWRSASLENADDDTGASGRP